MEEKVRRKKSEGGMRLWRGGESRVTGVGCRRNGAALIAVSLSAKVPFQVFEFALRFIKNTGRDDIGDEPAAFALFEDEGFFIRG